MLRRVLSWYAPYWRRERGGIAVVFLITVVAIASRTVYPLIFKFIIDALAVTDAGGRPDLTSARNWVLVLLGLGFLRSLSQAFLPSCRAWMNVAVGLRIRMEELRRVLAKRHDFFQRFQPGDLIARLTDDIDQGDKLSWYACSGVFRPIEAGLTLAFSLAVMFGLHWKLTLASTLPLPLIVWLLSKTETLQHRRYNERQQATSRTVETLEAGFSGARIVVGFGMEGAQERLFDRVLKERERTEKRVVSLQALLEGFFSIMNQVGLVIVLFLGGWFVFTDPRFTLGDFYAFVAYLSGLTMPLWTISWFFVSTAVTHTSIKRMQELEAAPERAVGREELPERHPVLKLEQLSFAYPRAEGEPVSVLKELSLSVRPGETVALVGPTGAGKSTIVNLAARFYEPTAGRILLDGVDMRERPLAWHQGRLGVVQQSPWLRNASLLENIRYGRLDATDEEVRAAAAAVGADAIASAVPEGWDFVVGEAGERLSLGQRQLVSLARAFLKDPDVFILDEATSSVDSETERAIQRAIDRVLRDRISFVIAHRLSTIRRATRIVLVDGGRIVESGTHAELMRARGPYHDLYMEQFVHDRERMVLGGGLTLPE